MIKDIPIGKNYPKIVNAIIEISKDTYNKYEYDEELDIIKLDRILHSPLHYPVDYGFIPQTRSDDGDHLDVMIVTNYPTFPGCLVEVRPVGVLLMSDENGIDEKILAVPTHNPFYTDIQKLSDINHHLLDEIVHFFGQYKKLENKIAVIKGWKNGNECKKVIEQSHANFLKTG